MEFLFIFGGSFAHCIVCCQRMIHFFLLPKLQRMIDVQHRVNCFSEAVASETNKEFLIVDQTLIGNANVASVESSGDFVCWVETFVIVNHRCVMLHQLSFSKCHLLQMLIFHLSHKCSCFSESFTRVALIFDIGFVFHFVSSFESWHVIGAWCRILQKINFCYPLEHQNETSSIEACIVHVCQPFLARIYSLGFLN